MSRNIFEILREILTEGEKIAGRMKAEMPGDLSPGVAKAIDAMTAQQLVERMANLLRPEKKEADSGNPDTKAPD